MKLFIYGTLKKGGALSANMKGQSFLGNVKTLPEYKLYKIGWFPGLVEDAEHGTSIEGELYEVDDNTVAVLDRVEGVPSLYRREPVKIQDQEDVQSYFYNKSVENLEDAGTSWKV